MASRVHSQCTSILLFILSYIILIIRNLHKIVDLWIDRSGRYSKHFILHGINSIDDVEMDVLFCVCMLGVVAVVPIHFLSVEHLKLEQKYGRDKGRRIGKICSLISGWGFFLFWTGLWFSPQPRFIVPVFSNLAVTVPATNLTIQIIHLLIFTPFFFIGAWLGIEGVRETTLRVAETHRTEKIITSGVYSIARHPQYLGGLLAHVGISFLLSASYSLLSTPLMVALVYLISRKEETELVREFGKEYEDYRKKVSMFMPKYGRSQKALAS